MKQFAVKNWLKHQHYKSRMPPWIKLHIDLLDDPSFELLTGEEVKTLIKIWLVVSKGKNVNGELPKIDKLCFLLRKPKDVVEEQLKSFVDSGWLVYCEQQSSNSLA